MMTLKIAVVNTKGGVGKSTAIMMLGLAFALQYNKKVLLVDTDTQADLSLRLLGNSLAKYSVVSDENYGMGKLASLFTIPPKPVNIIDNVDLIPMEYDSFMHVDQHAVMKRLASLPDNYDIILIDTPPSFDSVSAEELLRNIDAFYMLAVLSESMLTRLQAHLTIAIPAIIKKIRNNPYLIGIIKNSMMTTDSEYLESILSSLNTVCESINVPHYTPCVFENSFANKQRLLNYTNSFLFAIRTKNYSSISEKLTHTRAKPVAGEMLKRLEKITVEED